MIWVTAMIQGLWCITSFNSGILFVRVSGLVYMQGRFFITVNWVFFFNTFLLGFLSHTNSMVDPIPFPQLIILSLSCASLMFFLQFFFLPFYQVTCYVYFVEWVFWFSYLLKFWNISCFLLSSFSEISNGHCLSSVAFPSLITHSITP